MPLHTVSGAQTRFVVAVGAVDWYSVAVHVVRAAHTRSLVGVGALTWYCVPLQVVTGVQLAPKVLAGHWLQVLSLPEVQMSWPTQPTIGVHAAQVVPLGNWPAAHAHENVLVPVSVHGLPLHGLGWQSSRSTHAPAAFTTKPSAHCAQVSSVAELQVTLVQFASASHVLQTAPSS